MLRFESRLWQFGFPKLMLGFALAVCFASVPSSVWRSRIDTMLRFSAADLGLAAVFSFGITLSLLITVVYSGITPRRGG